MKELAYDGANRPTAESTGADVAAFYGTGSASVVTTQYSKRGTVSAVDGSYGTLLSSITQDADGLTEQITYGDVAQTSSAFQYDARRRLSSVLTSRGAPALWSTTPPAYSPAPNPGAGPSVFQTVLEHSTFSYDVVDNPLAITDGRSPSEWPTSFKPSSRQFQYDDLYRLRRSTTRGTTTGPRRMRRRTSIRRDARSRARTSHSRSASRTRRSPTTRSATRRRLTTTRTGSTTDRSARSRTAARRRARIS